ncbi:MAG TPA: YqgE/AlgH family protein [Burkholderiales bacterium]|nr:YqgE/AlgH family protein [Burkholderiales bacterium]
MKAILLVLAVVLPWAAPAAATDLSESVVLVAKRQLRDKMYGSTILVARPIGNDQHIGFIVNRPTKVTLGQLFPRHAPSQKVPDPVYVGGPISAESIFALVETRKHPGGRSVEIIPGMFAVFDSKIVDDVIEHEAGRARFVAGLVGWRAAPAPPIAPRACAAPAWGRRRARTRRRASPRRAARRRASPPGRRRSGRGRLRAR